MDQREKKTPSDHVGPLTTPQNAQPKASSNGHSVAEVCARHHTDIERFLRRRGVRDGDIEDLRQEVMLVIHRRLQGFESRSSLRTWIYGICVRVAADYHRRAHRRHETAARCLPEPHISAPQQGALELQQALSQLEEALGDLDDTRRETFLLYELHQYTMGEISKLLGCPVQTGYSRLRAARRHVDSQLSRESR
ncbi:MAG: RNA polymerase sigma factor [Myxococcales bacterium]|nr:RNA polymerase sigma factor [Myxococcales bacterium]